MCKILCVVFEKPGQCFRGLGVVIDHIWLPLLETQGGDCCLMTLHGHQDIYRRSDTRSNIWKSDIWSDTWKWHERKWRHKWHETPTSDCEWEDCSDAGLGDILVHRWFVCAVKQVPHIHTAILFANVEDGWATGWPSATGHPLHGCCRHQDRPTLQHTTSSLQPPYRFTLSVITQYLVCLWWQL